MVDVASRVTSSVSLSSREHKIPTRSGANLLYGDALDPDALRVGLVGAFFVAKVKR